MHDSPHQKAGSERSHPQRYQQCPTGVASAPDPHGRNGEVQGWEPGDRAHYAGRDYTILAISDNGVYLGYVVGGVSDLRYYVDIRNTTLTNAKWGE